MGSADENGDEAKLEGLTLPILNFRYGLALSLLWLLVAGCILGWVMILTVVNLHFEGRLWFGGFFVFLFAVILTGLRALGELGWPPSLMGAALASLIACWAGLHGFAIGLIPAVIAGSVTAAMTDRGLSILRARRPLSDPASRTH